MRARTVAVMSVAAAACVPPEPAPETLDALAGFLFAHADDPDDAALYDGLTKLSVWLDDHLDEVLAEDGYAVNNPSGDVLDALQDRVSLAEDDRLVGAAVGAALRYPSEDVAPLLTTINPIDLFPDSYAFYEREALTDDACFVDRTCDTTRQRNHSKARYAGGLFTIEQRNLADLRWVVLDAGPAIVHRTWITEPVKTNFGDLVRIPNQFYLNVVLPDPADAAGRHRRVQATWLVAESLSSDLPEGFALNLVIGSMRSGAEVTEAYYDGALD